MITQYIVRSLITRVTTGTPVPIIIIVAIAEVMIAVVLTVGLVMLANFV